jgi:RHS repeat-associated protein
MKYDAFGKITWLDDAFMAKPNSDYAWNRTFTGQVLDSETGLILYRNRYYHIGLGRFVSRDPVGYDAEDMNIYRYVFNSPYNWLDPYGLQFKFDCIPCSDLLEKALQELPTDEQELIQKCNINIKCGETCTSSSTTILAITSPAFPSPTDTHIHICFKDMESSVLDQKNFTALLMHEMVHVKQILDGRNKEQKAKNFLCPDESFDDDPPPVDLIGTDILDPRVRKQLYEECVKRETPAYTRQAEYLYGKTRDTAKQRAELITDGIQKSCGHLR